jgi:hypothetical protein
MPEAKVCSISHDEMMFVKKSIKIKFNLKLFIKI